MHNVSSNSSSTQLLRRMKQVFGDNLASRTDSTSLLHELFLRRLPANIRMILASVDSATLLQKLAEMAAKVMEVATPVMAVIDKTHSH